MVVLETCIHDAHYHALARVGGRQTDALLHLVGMGGGSGFVQRHAYGCAHFHPLQGGVQGEGFKLPGGYGGGDEA